MNTLQRVVSIGVAGLMAGTNAFAQQGFIPPASEELVRAITEKDRQLFAAVFDACDTGKLADLVAEDFEFYHDKSGHVFDSGSAWLKAVGEMCDRQKDGTDYRARRELDIASVRVYPLTNYGAIHMGSHRFYRKFPDGQEKLVEIALFTNLWKYEQGSWKLTRVLSYDHRAAQQAVEK
jgi:hypothetical protein